MKIHVKRKVHGLRQRWMANSMSAVSYTHLDVYKRQDPVASPQDGTPTKQESEKHQAAKQGWQPVGEDAQAG